MAKRQGAVLPPGGAGPLEVLGLGQFGSNQEIGLANIGPARQDRVGFTDEVAQTFAQGLFTPGQLPQGTNEGFQAVTDSLNQTLPGATQSLQDLIATGNPVDVSSVIEGAQRRFGRETVPLALEKLAGDFGVQSSSTRDALLQEAADLEAELAGLEVGAQETARERQLEATLGGAGALTGFAGGLGTTAVLQEQLRQATDPAQFILQTIERLFGLTSPSGQFLGPASGGTNPTQDAAAVIGSIGNLAN